MKKLLFAALLPLGLFLNVNGQEWIEQPDQLMEYEVYDEGYGYSSNYIPVSGTFTFMDGVFVAVVNFNTSATPPSNTFTLNAEIKRIEMLLNSLQTGTYPSTDLRNYLNQQNLTLSMLSTIMQNMRDSMRTIIRNLGG